MARISEMKVTLKEKTIFDKNEQTLEITMHMDDDYPYCSISTERWDLVDEKGFEALTNSIFDRFSEAFHKCESEI